VPTLCTKHPRNYVRSAKTYRCLWRLLADLRSGGLLLLILAHPGLVITDDALYGADSEDRALLAADGDGDGTECHGGPRKSEGCEHLFCAPTSP
jgi:hypothetical protein